ncbi:MAG: hypothetical protein V4692_11720, partial [Bdellovibrionota bacterium]
MFSSAPQIGGPVVAPQESRKRKREVVAVLLLALLFMVLTWVQFKLLNISQQLPFEHSIFFFGLVNFNIIILLLLFFLIFRKFFHQIDFTKS